MKALHEIDLDFAHVKLYDTYVISSIKEGVSLKKKQLNELFEIFNLYYENTPFVSIANREFDYSIDPNLLKTKSHPCIIGIAVVCYNNHSREMAQFEKKFYPGPFEIFENLKDAVSWSNQLIKENKKAGL